jgi:hypothetical protein
MVNQMEKPNIMQTTSEIPAAIKNICNEAIQSLSPHQRLELAALLLNGVVDQSTINESDEWSEDDLRDFSAASFCQSESKGQHRVLDIHQSAHQ